MTPAQRPTIQFNAPGKLLNATLSPDEFLAAIWSVLEIWRSSLVATNAGPTERHSRIRAAPDDRGRELSSAGFAHEAAAQTRSY